MEKPNIQTALGAEVGGHANAKGWWQCGDCPATGGCGGASALYAHRQNARHWEDDMTRHHYEAWIGEDDIGMTCCPRPRDHPVHNV